MTSDDATYVIFGKCEVFLFETEVLRALAQGESSIFLREALFTLSDEENQNVKICASPSLTDYNHFSPPSI